MNPYELLQVPVTATRAEIRTAYRKLARRWHPDRFMDGPERDWANDKMAEINSAYRACLSGIAAPEVARNAENEALMKVQQLIDDGNYLSARKMLMGFSTRCAEWNYLFGAVLMRMSEIDKAMIYLSVAAHQNPESAKYARALNEARRLTASPATKFASMFSRRKRL
ncbi:MAG: J domain-containing protein [Clostridia bacterium]|nr:J domain-containing protein [Clostridia bacterium]